MKCFITTYRFKMLHLQIKFSVTLIHNHWNWSLSAQRRLKEVWCYVNYSSLPSSSIFHNLSHHLHNENDTVGVHQTKHEKKYVIYQPSAINCLRYANFGKTGRGDTAGLSNSSDLNQEDYPIWCIVKQGISIRCYKIAWTLNGTRL